jgi:hypothetical protein
MLSIVHGAEVQFRHESAFRERERAVLAAIRAREAAVLALREHEALVAGVRTREAVLEVAPAKAARQRGPWARPIGVAACGEPACAVA